MSRNSAFTKTIRTYAGNNSRLIAWIVVLSEKLFYDQRRTEAYGPLSFLGRFGNGPAVGRARARGDVYVVSAHVRSDALACRLLT